MSRTTGSTLSGYRIKVFRENRSAIEHELEDGRSVFIGASDSCGIQIEGSGVAGIHCLIDVEDQQVFVQDWASEAGTKINGKPIEDKTPLQPGDNIIAGSVALELVGAPLKKNDPQEDAAAAAEPREESIGMETLGLEPDEDPPVGSNGSTPAVQALGLGGRLSDALTRSDEATEPDVAEPDVAETLPPDVAEDFLETASTDPDAFDETFAPHEDFDSATELASAFADEAGDPADAEPDDSSDPQPSLADDFVEHSLSADDLDWDPEAIDDDPVDPEIVQLLKNEIEDLRIQLAERDEQLSAAEGLQAEGLGEPAAPGADDTAYAGEELVGRVDELLAELEEHDERVATLQELLQTAEIQNQAEREERNCLENWVGEIEQRIGQRESEWQAEQDALRQRLDQVCEQRDQFQQKLHAAAKRFGKASVEDEAPDETLKQLQEQNAALQAELDQQRTRSAALERQIERLKTEEPESLQAERAELAKAKADVSRMRFELSKRLQDLGSAAPATNDSPDREFAYKLQTLREHLREIHEEEKLEREQRGESLFGRISGLWKRVEDRY